MTPPTRLFIALIVFALGAILCGQSFAQSDEVKLRAGDYTRTLRVGDLERRYRIYIPAKYNATKPTPVVVVFHGGGGNPESMIRLTGMNAKADESGFIVVYPFGTGKLANSLLTFNGGDRLRST